MGVRLIVDEDSSQAVLYCSTSGVAFGPVWDGREQAEHFLAWFDEHHACHAMPDVRTAIDGKLHAIADVYRRSCPTPCDQADHTCRGPVGHSPLLDQHVCRKHYHDWAKYASPELQATA